jgi:exodeoxyribonuclease VII large subunit
MAASSPFDDDDTDDGLVAKDRPGGNAEPLSVSEISALLKRTVEDRFGFVRIRGELSGVKRAASGHLYCSLKDEGARIDGVMWKGSVQRLGFMPEDGVEVIATGKLTTYPGRSNYQIVIDRMEIAGEGALLALLAKTKARLEAEGLFAPERKRAIPFLPRVIGVVTSPTGAVIRDILHRLADRFPSQVLVWPVLVQGKGSAEQVAAAVRGFSDMAGADRPDVLIIARGGGSIEDLWGFNEEVVVRAIADCTIPIISAVGHETDTTLADFAADHRAPTPTAAAERAVPVREELLSQLGELALRQRRAVVRPLTLGKERLEVRAQRLPRPEVLLATYTQRLDEKGERLRRGLADRAAIARGALAQDSARLSAPLLLARLDRAKERLANVRLSPTLVERRIAEARERSGVLWRMAEQLSPRRVLERGYAIVRDAKGEPLMRAAEVQPESALEIEFFDGRITVGEANTAAASPPPPRARPASPRRPDAPEQGKLL